MKSRKLFTDKWNSFWHMFFGIISVRYLFIIPLFILYQLYDYKDPNLFVDLSEFFIGLVIGFFILYVFFKAHNPPRGVGKWGVWGQRPHL